MQTYISLLRGINVSGQKMIKMAELKAAYEELKLKNVRTYIQSGNVIFKDKTADTEKLSSRIVKKIKEKFGFDVPVIVISWDELAVFFSNNPFLGKRNEDISKLHLTLLSEVPDLANAELANKFSYPPDEFTIKGKGIFLFCPNGYGNTKLNNHFFENKLKVTATTRNWKTVVELMKMAGEQ